MDNDYDCHCECDVVEFLLEPNIIADLIVITASITTPHKNCRRGVPRRGGGEGTVAQQRRAAVNLIKVYGGGQFVEIERDLGEDF